MSPPKSLTDFAPEPLLKDVRQHFKSKVKEAESGFECADRKEDALTGALCALLRTDWSRNYESDGVNWKWKINYRAFGSGNQNSSEENTLGADAIIQIEVKKYLMKMQLLSDFTATLDEIEEAAIFGKGLLFQSKRKGSSDSKQNAQLKKIEKYIPGHGILFEYADKNYRVAKASDILKSKNVVNSDSTDDMNSLFSPLGEFLSNDFLGCTVGVQGMHVDYTKQPRVLYIPRENGLPQLEPIQINHSLTVEFKAYQGVFINQGYFHSGS